MMEGLIAALWRDVLGVELPLPLRRMTYAEAMEKYGVDKPDLRLDLELCDVTEAARASRLPRLRAVVAGGGIVKCLRVPRAGDKLPRSMLDGLTDFAKPFGVEGRGVRARPGGRRLAGAVRQGLHRRGARRGQPARRRRPPATCCSSSPRSQGGQHVHGRDPPAHRRQARPHPQGRVAVHVADRSAAVRDRRAGPARSRRAPPVHLAAPEDEPQLESAPGRCSRAPTTSCSTASRSAAARSVSTARACRRASSRRSASPTRRRSEVRLPARGVQVRAAAARRHRVRPRPPGDADGRRRVAARRDRLPQDAEGHGPHDRVPDAGVEEAARRALRDGDVEPRRGGSPRARRACGAGRAVSRRRRCRSSTPSIGVPSKRDDQIAVDEAGARRRAAGSTDMHLDRGRAEARGASRAGDRAGGARAPTPSQARRTRPCCEQLAEHPRRGLDADREADALRARDDRGVDADHAAAPVEQRPAGVAGVERRGVLDDAVDQAAVAAAQRAAERRDHAGRHRRLEAERVADRDDELAEARRAGAVDRRYGTAAVARGERRRIDLDQREVGRRIVADHCASSDLARRRAHLDLARRRR